VREEEWEVAASTLETLKAEHPNNSIVLSLQKTTYRELGEWQALIDLLPKLHKAKLIDELEQNELNERAQCGLLEDIASQQGSEGLINHWNKLPRKTRQSTHLVGCFSKQLIARKADAEAFTVIKETLKKQGHDDLYKVLPELNLADTH
ncbi:heme biosynthesis protein HemY, partial [Vibrio alfacsensis]